MRLLKLTPKMIDNLTKALKKNPFPKENMLEYFPKTCTKQRIIFTEIAWNKMQELVHQSSKEIGWHGYITRGDQENTWVVYDIVVFPQTVTSMTVTPDADEFAKWQMERMKDESLDFNEMKMHGHSHVNMNVSPSGTDTTYQEDILKNLREDDYYLFLIINKKGDIWAQLYDTKNWIRYDKTDLIITHEYDASAWAKRIIKENITEKKYASTSRSTYSQSQIYINDYYGG